MRAVFKNVRYRSGQMLAFSQPSRGGVVVEPSSNNLLLARPVCPNCKVPMRYQSSELDKEHAHIRHVMFVCSCGLTSDQMVAAPD
jgi:hypothetical protein